MDREAQFPPPGPLIGPERPVMAGSYGKQRELDIQLVLQPLQEALNPLQEKTGVDFFDIYQKRYDLEPQEGKKKEEEIVRKTVKDVEDLKDYFEEQEGRTYYLYIESRFHPEKPLKKCQDFIIMEEKLPNGKILSVFKYGTEPGKLTLEGGEKYEYRTLAGCYAITTDKETGQEMAVDLTSFWTGAPSQTNINKLRLGIRNSRALFKVKQKYPGVNEKEIAKKAHFDALTEENRVLKIGLINRRSSAISPEEQIELIKEYGYFLFEDQTGSEKWLPIFQAAAAFSQYEGDKSETHMRSDLPLGAIRLLLGETTGNEKEIITEFLIEANRQAEEIGAPLRQIISETRDWIRNRIAVSLYTIRKLHQMGIDFLPKDEYSRLSKIIKEKLELIETISPGIEGITPNLV